MTTNAPEARGADSGRAKGVAATAEDPEVTTKGTATATENPAATSTGKDATNAGAAATTPSDGGGLAPRGMWWAAWRQHRTHLLFGFGLMGAVALWLLYLRFVKIPDHISPGCSGPDDQDYCWEWATFSFDAMHSIAHLAMVAAPWLLAAFFAAPLFPRESEHGTDVWALTQAVNPRRWWVSKVVVMGVPLVAGLLALGFMTSWIAAVWFCETPARRICLACRNGRSTRLNSGLTRSSW